MKVSINGGEDMTTLEERFAAMVEFAKNPDDARAKSIIDADTTDDLPEPIYTERYQEKYMYGSGNGIRMYNFHNRYDEEEDAGVDEFEDDEYFDEGFDSSNALADMINHVRDEQQREIDDFENRSTQQMDDYLIKYRENNVYEEEDVEESHEIDEPESTTNTNNDIEIKCTTPDPIESILRDNHTIHNGDNPPVDEVNAIDSPIADDTIDEDVNPEDAAVLVNGKPLPIGEEVIL